MKKILIINGHPEKGSFCAALAKSYQKGAQSIGAECKLVNLCELKFDPILHIGYRAQTELEPDLIQVQQDISAADHLVFVYPNWWGTYPALLKGFFDRVLIPGFAFKYHTNNPFWDKLLTGKTARLLVTMDTPPWYYNLGFGKPGHNSMKNCILGFCGVKPVKISVFSPIRSSTDKMREKYLTEAEKLGEELK
jgi:putative NADPH-quinone reductase